MACGRETRFRLGLSRAHSLTFLDKAWYGIRWNEQNHEWNLIIESFQSIWEARLPSRGQRASPSSKAFHAFDQTLTLILKNLRNIEKSMIRKSQIFNFYSGDLSKKIVLLKISIFFSEEITQENFELMAFYSPWVVFL